jgi:hypothetical protein
MEWVSVAEVEVEVQWPVVVLGFSMGFGACWAEPRRLWEWKRLP